MQNYSDIHMTLDDETLDRAAKCQSVMRLERQTTLRTKVSRSRVIREAVEMFYRYTVLRQSIIHPDDPRV